MREIKFRAWDNGNKEMAHWGIGFDDVSSEISVRSVKDTISLSSERYVFMQYTGLKDKNGKEIYEGDIMTSTIGERSVHISKVVWMNGGFYAFGILIGGLHKYEFEIIGNIYQDSHLLNK
jgi:uncharacterized phage protein (TIGR01671 family)